MESIQKTIKNHFSMPVTHSAWRKNLTTNNTNLYSEILSPFVLVRRTGGHLKATLLFFQTAAFIGATLCGIIHLHGFAVRLFSGFVVEFSINLLQKIVFLNLQKEDSPLYGCVLRVLLDRK
jgi:hypothetical protein